MGIRGFGPEQLPGIEAHYDCCYYDNVDGMQLRNPQIGPTRYNRDMRQPIELKGPGASPEDVAEALGVTPERQAAIREILRLHRQGNAAENGSKHKVAAGKTSRKKSASRK